jgi:hypothetical protein
MVKREVDMVDYEEAMRMIVGWCDREIMPSLKRCNIKIDNKNLSLYKEKDIKNLLNVLSHNLDFKRRVYEDFGVRV